MLCTLLESYFHKASAHFCCIKTQADIIEKALVKKHFVFTGALRTEKTFQNDLYRKYITNEADNFIGVHSMILKLLIFLSDIFFNICIMKDTVL